MSKDKGPWRDGLRAWERLAGWLPGASATADPSRALAALADVGVLRHLLDQAELSAVRAARGERKSWSEIATMLGVTRQSAWERWRDLDDATGETTAAPPGHSSRVLAAVSADAAGRAASASRRRSSVSVPNVIGRTWVDALEVLRAKGLVAVGVGPDAAEAGAPEWPASVITDQVPESGAKVAPGAVVRLWYRRGGGAGVREPRRPKPAPDSALEARPEPSDEAVG